MHVSKSRHIPENLCLSERNTDIPEDKFEPVVMLFSTITLPAAHKIPEDSRIYKRAAIKRTTLN